MYCLSASLLQSYIIDKNEGGNYGYEEKIKTSDVAEEFWNMESLVSFHQKLVPEITLYE
jgi:hypothetical protein